ncbi:hypothetical protein I546_3287 [Mycobacterium kansasii 732]|nr:hypothetical protein I546_3287 [Mycobacterium kansasii 732]
MFPDARIDRQPWPLRAAMPAPKPPDVGPQRPCSGWHAEKSEK